MQKLCKAAFLILMPALAFAKYSETRNLDAFKAEGKRLKQLMALPASQSGGLVRTQPLIRQEAPSYGYRSRDGGGFQVLPPQDTAPALTPLRQNDSGGLTDERGSYYRSQNNRELALKWTNLIIEMVTTDTDYGAEAQALNEGLEAETFQKAEALYRKAREEIAVLEAAVKAAPSFGVRRAAKKELKKQKPKILQACLNEVKALNKAASQKKDALYRDYFKLYQNKIS